MLLANKKQTTKIDLNSMVTMSITKLDRGDSEEEKRRGTYFKLGKHSDTKSKMARVQLSNQSQEPRGAGYTELSIRISPPFNNRTLTSSDRILHHGE